MLIIIAHQHVDLSTLYHKSIKLLLSILLLDLWRKVDIWIFHVPKLFTSLYTNCPTMKKQGRDPKIIIYKQTLDVNIFLTH